MSFYHVLPSNAAPNTYPNNHASEFSTPLDNPYNLEGRWEVAMMNMSYTGCVNTFYNDRVSVTHAADLKPRILKTTRPVRWRVPQKKTVSDMLKEFESLKDIMEFTIDDDGLCRWKLIVKHLFVILSPSLTKIMSLDQEVITPWDDVRQWFKCNTDDPMPEHVSFTFVPISFPHHTYQIKADNEKMTLSQMIEKFNETIPHATMIQTNDGIQTTVTQGVIILSSTLGDFISYEQHGIHKKVATQVFKPNMRMTMENPWTVRVYTWDKEDKHTDLMEENVTLPPIQFQRHEDALRYLNKHIPYVSFTLSKQNYLQVDIPNKNVSITLTDTLRDILAFDENTYTGPGIFRATGVFSLTRRIHFLYVYSNLTEYVRIGNMEAPLLAVIPFSESESCDILKEQSYKNPMYIPLRHSTMSQIDIAIHDDAGALVPFASGAVTSIRLHYRKL